MRSLFQVNVYLFLKEELWLTNVERLTPFPGGRK